MPYQNLLIETAGPVATVTLNRPKVLNAINADMLRELEAVFTACAGDHAVRVVLLRGAGGKAFAAGADIAELAAASTADAGEELARRAQRVLSRIENLGKPVIACIDGFALGGGCELALACTLRLGTPHARFGQPELKLGVIPGWGGTQRLPRLIGRASALKLILTGEIIPAAAALRLGLLDEVVANEPADGSTPDAGSALMTRAHALATQIAAQAQLAVAAALEAVTQGADLPLGEALALEASLFGRLCATPDKREGTNAFLEKRPPHFTGP